VGGKADQIVLWPLGGVAYVDPPPRAGATLWSIAAGPLVNVVLLPILYGIVYFSRQAGWPESGPDMYAFFSAVAYVNLILLCFNILPIYPLDGGQILRSLLWFGLGQARSLIVAAIIGFIGGAGLLFFIVTEVRQPMDQLYLAALVGFLLLNCWRGFQHALRLLKVEKLPRRPGFACPVCHVSPPIGKYWQCQLCSQPFDMFASQTVCPHCGTSHELVPCPDCGNAKPLLAWDTTIREA
jgi:Zn-dependent protease